MKSKSIFLWTACLYLLAVQESFAQEKFEWQQISPTNITTCEKIAVTKSKRLLVFTRNTGVFDVAKWTPVNSNLPVISNQVQPIRATTIANNGVWEIVQRNLVFLNDTGNTWGVSGFNTSLTLTELHYFNGLYASASTLAPNSERLLFSNDEGKIWVQKMEGFSQNAVYASSFITLDSTLMVGTTEGIFIRDNNSALWKAVYQQNPSPTPSPWYVFKGTDNICFAQNYGTKEILRSENKGNSWQQVQFVVDSLFDVTSYGQMIFFATNKGIFISFDGGKKIENISLGLPVASVQSITALGEYIYLVSQGKVYQAKIIQTDIRDESVPNISKISVYPNPNINKCHLRFSVEGSTSVLIEVFNNLGVKVESRLKENVIQEQIQEIHTEHYPNGSYIVRVTANGKSQSVKFVVKR